ncbi:MAG: PhnD/SsuA/transferrin family substrate-binding protein [Phycisphaerae bacterium]
MARVTLILSVLVVPLGTTSWAHEAPQPVKIGMLAKRGPERCLEKWGPTGEYLTSQIPGHSFTIVPLDFEEIDPAVERGEVDFILANSSFYVGLEKLYGANRIATLKNRRTAGVYTVFGGVILRRADREDIQDLDDLKGKTFMAVEETSFGGWQMACRELKERGIDPHHDFSGLTFGGTHDAVVYAVRDGKVDAGTVRTDTLERMAAEGKIRLEDFHALRHDHIGEEVCEFPFLHSTDMYPEWPFAKLKHTSDDLAQQVAVALFAMPPDSPPAQAARCAGWTVPHNYQAVHECLKELRVRPYEDFGKITFSALVRQHWPWIVSATVLLAVMAVVLAWALRLLRQRKRAEEAVRGSEGKFRSLVETTSDWVWEVDRNGFYTYASPRVKDLLGYEPEEVIGKTAFDFMPADEAERAARFFKDRAESREPLAGLENTNLHRDGRHVVLETNGVPILDAGGNLLGYRGIDRDIIERKQAEATLREAKEQAEGSARRATEAMADMERMNAVMMGREERVLEMKQEVNELLAQLGQARKYEHV